MTKGDYNLPGLTVVKKLGDGGTAEVFLINHPRMSRPAVLKRFVDAPVDDLVKREKAVARFIRYPGVVRLIDTVTGVDGKPALCFEYCPGPLLEELAGKVSETKLLAILSALSASLTVLHTAGYIHNDLKPSNVFCPVGFETDEFPLQRLFYLKLFDFSLSRPVTENGPQPIAGTVGYMSPEMIDKKRLTYASDLFSLGVVAYYLACGRMPFGTAQDDPLEISARIREDARPSFTGPGQSYSQETRDLIHSLLEVNPTERPPSAFALMEWLSRVGSPYPYRRAIHPRHLLTGREAIDPETFNVLFGANSCSERQAGFLQDVTGGDPLVMRLVLEHNFRRGRFARLDGRWGWINELHECIEWPKVAVSLCLRPLRATPVSTKKSALAMALIGDDDQASDIITGSGEGNSIFQALWKKLDGRRRPPFLYALQLRMHRRTRKALAARLHLWLEGKKDRSGLRGRLLFDAGLYESAIASLFESIDTANAGFRRNELFENLELARQAAEALGDREKLAESHYRRACLEKEFGFQDAAEQSFNRAVEAVQDFKYHEMAARSLKKLGDLYKEKSDYASGVRVLNQAREIFQYLGDRLGLSQTLNNLGNIHWVAGRLDKALEHYREAMEIQRELGSEKEIASSLNNIGSISIIRGQYQDGLLHLYESLKIKERLGDKAEIARTWNNLGVTYFMMGKTVEALEAFSRSFALNTELGVKVEQMINLENLAELSIQAGRLKDALGYIRQCHDIVEALGDDGRRAIVARLTGLMLRRMGSFEDAEKHLMQAYEISQRLESPTLVLPVLIALTRLYFDLHDKDMADRYLVLAESKAEEVGDKQAQFSIALMRYQITGDTACLQIASELLEIYNSPRDKGILFLTRLEHCNLIEALDESWECVTGASQFFEEAVEDIEHARYHMAVGVYHNLGLEPKTARSHFEKALQMAAGNNLLPEKWQAACLLSEMAFGEGDFEMSFEYARQATETLKSISEQLSRQDRMQKYYSDKRIISLLGRTKSLKAVLGQKKGVAVGDP